MAFPTLSQLKSRVWSTKDEAEQALKASALPVESPTYRVSHDRKLDRWYIEDIEPAHREATPVVQLNTGKHPSPSSRIKAAAAVVAKQGPKPGRETLPASKRKAAANGQCSSCGGILTDANKKAGTQLCDACAGRNISALPAAKTATPASPKAAPAAAAKKSDRPPADPLKGGPDPAKLPKGFAEWAVAQAQSKDGVMRVDLKKKYGHEVKWFGYLKSIAEPLGLVATMERDGRLTRFRMKGGTAMKAAPVATTKATPAPAPAKAPAAKTAKASGKTAPAAAKKNDVTPRFRKGAGKVPEGVTKH